MRLNFAMLSDPIQKPVGQGGTEGTASTDAACSSPTLSGDSGDKVGQSLVLMTDTQTDQPEMSHLSHHGQNEVGRCKPSIDAAVPYVPFVPPKNSINETTEETIEKRNAIRVADGYPARDQKGEVTGHPHETQAAIAECPDRVTKEPFTQPLRQPLAPLTLEEEIAIRAWLAQIEETNPAAIAEIIDQCQRDRDARRYFIDRATAEQPKPDTTPDDRRTCGQCENLIDQHCCGEMVAILGCKPNCDQPRRCEGYMPGEDDPDRRLGWERWPGLNLKITEDGKAE